MPVETVEVPVTHPYRVFIGAGLDLAEIFSRSLEPGLCAIFTDSTVGPLHGARVQEALQRAGWRVAGKVEVPSGETSKSMHVYADALGRLVGAFVKPRLVAADLDWVATLPEREVSNGLAETIKMGLLAGGDFFDDLGLIGAARTGDLDALETLVLHSVRFKSQVVAEDELEGGLRQVLNYGHTLGHALEAAADYDLQHGRAVAAGMLAAASLARNRYGRDLTSVHEDLLEAAGLPRRVPDVGFERALLAMGRDKKRHCADGSTRHRFVLLEDIGRPVRSVPVSEVEAREAIGAILE